MESKKCSFEEHNEKEAVFYCQECNIYMCNKCENLHSQLFKGHHKFKLNENINEIFTGLCKEENHNLQLEFFCKNHNKLCCSICLCKIKKEGKGQHTNCDVCLLEDVKEIKKNKLKENMKILDLLNNTLEDSINNLKEIFEKINKNKEELKLEIQNVFTKIRNEVNEREDKLLSKIDEEFDNLYFKEDIIKESQKLPEILKKSLQLGKIEDKDWNDKNKLNLLINNCINIENAISNINIINESIKKFENSNDLKIKFNPEEIYIQKFLKSIKEFGEIISENNLNIFDNSLIINNNKTYINNLFNWINEKNESKKFKASLLYRKSRDGDSYNTFHNLCDNKGTTLVLYKSNEGFIIGGYTPLDWDNHSSWKNDKDSFLFSLTKNKVYKKKNKTCSIYCDKSVGPWFAYIGCRDTGKKNMSQGNFLFNADFFENLTEIIPNQGREKFFDLEEVEVYKIIFN